MAEETSKGAEQKPPVVTITTDSGTITASEDDVRQIIEDGVQDGFNGAMESSYSVLEGHEGLVLIDLHPDNADFKERKYVPLIETSLNDGIAGGRYWILYTASLGGFDSREIKHIENVDSDGLMVATDTAQIIGEGLEPVPVTISPTDENGEPYEDAPYEPIQAWIIRKAETGDFVTLYDVLRGVMVQAVFEVMIDRGELVMDRGKDEQQLPTIVTQQIDKTDFPLDKINANVWKLLEGAESGQIGFDITDDVQELGINVARAGSLKEVVITYSIDFSDIEDSITKKLEPYDKRVCTAIAALYNAGYKVVTLQMIYAAMGNDGKIGQKDKDKINDSITKMNGARILVDNTDEASVYNRDEFIYDGQVLPMERITAIANGQIVNGAIHVFREPPLITFAKERKQFTTIDVKLLNSPLSKTSANLQLEDYLIERISHIKKKGKKQTSNRILFKTIYENAGIKTSKQRLRAANKIKKLLNHYKGCNFIDGYKIEGDGITIFY